MAQVAQFRFLTAALAIEPRLGIRGRAMGGVAEVLPVPLGVAALVRAVRPTSRFHAQRRRWWVSCGRFGRSRRWGHRPPLGGFGIFGVFDHRQFRRERLQRNDGGGCPHRGPSVDLGAVDAQPLALARPGDPSGFAEAHRLGEHLLPEAALCPLLGAQLHQRRLVGNRVGKREAAEPAKARVHGQFVTQLPLAEAVEVLEDPHPDHQFRIDRRPAKPGVERGDLLPDEPQVESGVQSPQDVVRGHEGFHRDALGLVDVVGLLTEHTTSLLKTAVGFPPHFDARLLRSLGCSSPSRF